MEKEKRNRIIGLAIIGVILVALGVFLFGREKASWYTEKQHVKRITRSVNKQFMTNGSDFVSFEVYPLYSQDDKLGYFLVEFEPFGFMYVKMFDSYPFIARKSCCGRKSLYAYDGDPRHRLKIWSRFEISLGDIRYFEKNDDFSKVEYLKSPFAAADIKDEKRYMLDMKDENGDDVLIPAVKREDGYLNLFSLTYVRFEQNRLIGEQAVTTFDYCHGCYLM